MKRIAIFLIFSCSAIAQVIGDGGGGNNGTPIVVANAGTTGTTLSTLTKLTGAPSTAVKAATTDTSGVVGITIGGPGTTGFAAISTRGLVNCIFSGATTSGHYVQISTATAGDCMDSGAGTWPLSGQVIGRVLSTNASAGTYQIYLFQTEIQASSGITALSAVTSKWINSVSSSGVFTSTQPASSDISFTDPATGAVPENQNTINLETRDVTRFGAKCDNSTDDSTALQASVSWWLANGGRLTSPTGRTCKFTVPIDYNYYGSNTTNYTTKILDLQGGIWSGSVPANNVAFHISVNGAGHVTSSGTTVTWVDGTYFSPTWAGKSITVNGVGLTVASVTSSKVLVTTGSSTNASPVAYTIGNTNYIVRDVTIENGQIIDTGGNAAANISVEGSDPSAGNFFGGMNLNNLWCYAAGGDCIDVVNVFESQMFNVNTISTVFTGNAISFINGLGNQTAEWIISRCSSRDFLNGLFMNGATGQVYQFDIVNFIALQAKQYGIYINNGAAMNLIEPHVEDNWNGNCNSVVNAQFPGIYFVSSGQIIGAEGGNGNPGTPGVSCAVNTYGQQSVIWSYNTGGAASQTNIIGGFGFQMNGAFAYVNGTSTGYTNLMGVPGYSDISGGVENIALMSAGVSRAATYLTSANCSNAASPAVCAAAPNGAVAIPTGVNPTLVVNSSSVTSKSNIVLTADDSLTIAATTCNSTLATLVGGMAITARTPGTSFTISYNGTITTNKLCVSYLIEN